jgi:hypothetical protein
MQCLTRTPCHKLLLIVVLSACSVTAHAQPPSRTLAEREAIRKQVIYLVLTDRFFNGDLGNDRLVNAAETDSTKTCLDRFFGGDIAGVKKQLDYLASLGVNTVWITPVYKQVHAIPSGGTGYHG